MTDIIDDDTRKSARSDAKSRSTTKSKPLKYRLCDPKRFDEKAKERSRKCVDKAVRRYYRVQAKLLCNYAEDREHSSKSRTELSVEELISTRQLIRKEHILERLSIDCNFCLLIGKLVAAFLSGSLSIYSSSVDSMVDTTSGVVIWLSSRAIRNRDLYHYPRGRTRLEPLGLIFIAMVMGVASLLIIIKSIESMIEGTVNPKMAFRVNISGTNDTTTIVDWRILGPMIATILVKATFMRIMLHYRLRIADD